jgi:hypothetical protein
MRERHAQRVLACRPEGKGRLEDLSGREEDNIKTDLKDIGWVDVAWTDEAQDRDKWQAVVNAAMNLKFT